eukprot:TRINITY_DN205_c0_g1_i1.p1 TRINITY_DN205_c0_g1~~TRINITY_DN205_c0_g1_i1.p1  ORF type:complete len:218 (-),score=45.52 TRINITY_DN205_c0_g1_i1:88-741(-)
MSKPKLTYFNVKGRAEFIRYIFAEKQIDYEDSRFEFSAEGAKKENLPTKDEVMGALKEQGKLDFNQVPLLEIDGHNLVQSQAIASYLARKYNLYGKDNYENYQVDALYGALIDALSDLYASFRAKENKDELLKQYSEVTLPKWLGFLEKVLSRNNGGDGFAVGNDVTLGDFYLLALYESVERFNNLANFPKLAAHKERIVNRPNIKAYIEKRPKTTM